MLDAAARAVERVESSANKDNVKWVLGFAAWSAAYVREFELAASYLEKAVLLLDLDNVTEILPEERSTTFRQFRALHFAQVYQSIGQPNQAAEFLLESRRVDPLSAKVTDYYESTRYIDAQYEALSGNPLEALNLLRYAIEHWQVWENIMFPSAWSLETNPILDSIREHPEYGPQLLELIEELDATLAPMRKRELEAEASGDWEALRKLPEDLNELGSE